MDNRTIIWIMISARMFVPLTALDRLQACYEALAAQALALHAVRIHPPRHARDQRETSGFFLDLGTVRVFVRVLREASSPPPLLLNGKASFRRRGARDEMASLYRTF